MIKHELMLQQYPSLHTIVAVSKTKPKHAIEKAIEAGYTNFGENKAQELKDKAILLPNVTWHFIGHLQRNKVKDVIKYASWIHSVDSLRLIDELRKETLKIKKDINILIQVNLTNEVQKSGCVLEDLDQLVETVKTSSYLHLKGFMVIGPTSLDLDETRYVFKKAKELLNKYHTIDPNISELSMGMSQDYKIAIEEGSTIIRIGSLLFGHRT